MAANSTIEINIRGDVQKAMAGLSDLQQNAVKQAAARALNRTADTVKSRATKEISTVLGVPQKFIRPNIHIWKANKNALAANISARGRGLPLSLFKPRQTDEGVTYTAFGETRLAERAFLRRDIAARSVWKRIPRRTITAAPIDPRFPRLGFKQRIIYHGGLVPRVPIRRLYGPSVPAGMSRTVIMEALKTLAGKEWRKNFPREMEFYLRRLRGG